MGITIFNHLLPVLSEKEVEQSFEIWECRKTFVMFFCNVFSFVDKDCVMSYEPCTSKTSLFQLPLKYSNYYPTPSSHTVLTLYVWWRLAAFAGCWRLVLPNTLCMVSFRRRRDSTNPSNSHRASRNAGQKPVCSSVRVGSRVYRHN